MSSQASTVRDLPDGEQFAAKLAGRRPAVFLDYDGVLTPIVDRPVVLDEDAFRALAGRGVGIIVGHPDDPEVANRPTAADFVLESTVEVEQFLNTLAR